ncbi:MAG: hypothetical protein HeimC2_25810 [Candidatus Heimdallarchaeota archaeon LC_2]|nr:MAG: hypothetical protein HeimC2_25810 [Candidatus Heimdallarchaeota archaeon LC_2]
MRYAESVGVLKGKSIKVPLVKSYAIACLTRGADQLIVPFVGGKAQDNLQMALDELPSQRKGMIKMVDKTRAVYKLVSDYIFPFTEMELEWPDTVFINNAGDLLYDLIIAEKYKSAIGESRIQNLREFVPGLSFEKYKDEAKFRLAEIIDLICCYTPLSPDFGHIHLEQANPGVASDLLDIMRKTQFDKILMENGKIGYLTNPRIGALKIWNVIKGFFQQQKGKKFLTIAKTAAEITEFQLAAKGTNFVKNHFSQTSVKFSPQFVEFGPVKLPMAQNALKEYHPKVKPNPGTIMTIARPFHNEISYSWLNEGEEMKLISEAKNNESRMEDYQKCISVRDMIF